MAFVVSSTAAAHHRTMPPRPQSAGGSTGAGTAPSLVSPRATKFAIATKSVHARTTDVAATLQQTATPTASPRRPMSASRVQPTAASLAHAVSASPSSPTSPSARHAQTRPASASRSRASPQTQYRPFAAVDTIAFPLAHIELSSRECGSSQIAALKQLSPATAASPRSLPRTIASVCSTIRQEQLASPAPMDATERAKLRAFLESWQDDASSFRSAILFSETTFAQAKAMVAEWPTPNAFLSAIAYGCLEQFGLFLAKDYPFLSDVITELGAAVYSNFADLLALQRQQELEAHALPLQQQQQSEPRNRFLFYFQHGQHWFHELAEQKRRAESLQFTAASSRDEVQRLTDKLHTQHVSQSHRSNSLARAGPDAVASHTTIDDALGTRSESASALFPQIRNLLYCDTGRLSSASTTTPQSSAGSVRLDFHASDYDFWPCCNEIALVFQSLPRKEAAQVLSTLLERAAELELPGLGETYAIAVDLLREPERRAFLREYFLLVAPAELQDALQQRDECNDEKRWQLFVDELKDRLGIADSDDEDGNCSARDTRVGGHTSLPLRGLASGATSSSNANADKRQQNATAAAAAKRLTRFHTDEAKVGAKVHDMVELLEDLAAEASFLDEHHAGFSPALLKKLRAFEDPTKRIAKARELMTNAHSNTKRTALSPDATDVPQPCACHCGQHQLVHIDDLAALQAAAMAPTPAAPNEDLNDDTDAADKSSHKRKTSRRSSRPLSAKRKNALNYGSRLASPRGSTTQLRLFPLAEVCHMLSAILHLQFSRDTAEMAATAGAIAASRSSGSGGRNSVVALSAISEDRWSFLRRPNKPATFKTLAKEFLTRKYGIKSIAVMHTLQLERSLVYYSAMDKHVRCELFAWFFGADKPRLASKDYAFRFFQRLVKSIMSVFVPKRPSAPPLSSLASGATSALSTSAYQQAMPLPFATLVSIWTEYIGDGEASLSGNSATGTLVRYLAPGHAIETCNVAFPVRIKETSDFSSLVEKLYQLGLERDQVELEAFLKRAMEVWQCVFDRFADDVLATLEATSTFDFDAFTAAVVRNGMELTGGERLEIFDLLSQDSDESVVSRAKLLGFVLEAKYLCASDS